MSEKINTIYITFNGITDPLGQSQVLPYLEELSKNGVNFYLISLEKDLNKSKELLKDIEGLGIKWYRLKYFKFSFFLDEKRNKKISAYGNFAKIKRMESPRVPSRHE